MGVHERVKRLPDGTTVGTGKYIVYVYNPAVGRKVYVGTRDRKRGQGGALELFREKTAEFNGQPVIPTAELTCDQYADRWLDAHHGEGTRRLSPRTLKLNRGMLKPFRDEFGDRLIDGGISREEALDWSRKHRTHARAVAAMFADAIDEERATANPFANRRLPGARGRKDIAPLTETEVDELAGIARTVWGKYGLVVAGWILFLAWTGCRPGEAARREWKDVDLEAGRLTVTRIKGDKQTDVVVCPPAAVAALLAMPGERSGRLFLTAQGCSFDKGAFAYYWSPVRAAFVAKLKAERPDRLAELEQVKGALDLYALRHFCGSIMADRGANEFEIAHQLGNSPEVCREVYVHVHRDRVNERNAMFLGANVADMESARRRRSA